MTKKKNNQSQPAFQTVNKISEMVWLSISIVTFIFTVVIFIRDGAETASAYLIIVLIAFSYYLLRRWLRKRVEKNMNLKNNNPK
jgi:membrane protein DedA with SNARE-associated domain